MDKLGAGIRVGHWTDTAARTGCTVVLLPDGAVASGEVRGGAPATREFALLDPTKSVSTVHAIVLTGGSAFGLASCDGVMQWLEHHGRGFETAAGLVPIVVGLGLFDLAVGDASVRPGPDAGIAACEAATTQPTQGAVGAGAGCTVGKWGGDRQDSGLGIETVSHGDYWVTAIVAVNAYGHFNGTVVSDPGPPARQATDDDIRTNTTIGVVVTNAKLDKVGCRLLAESAHGGLSRALYPAHTASDGDAIVGASVGEVEADPHHVRLLAQLATERAIDRVAAETPGPNR
ncbi:MAG: P1 family peptidase [Acidimicrobiales bacterium]